MPLDREDDVGALAATDPVALHDLDRLRPVELVEIGEQPFGVLGDAQHPLLQRSLVDGMVAALAPPFGGDLLVGEHRPERRAPVDGDLVEICQAERVDDLAAFELVQLAPVATVRDGACAGIELGDQLADRPGLVLLVVVPGVEHLQEDPLRPAVVLDVGGRHAAAGVVPEPEPAQLAPHRGDVLVGRDPRMLPRLERILLGRQPECVVPHRVEHVVARHALEPREDISADVAEGMSNMEARAARIREHVEHVELRAVGDALEAIGERTAGVRRPERPLLFPAVLPSLLDLVGKARGVAVRRSLFGARSRLAHARPTRYADGRAYCHSCTTSLARRPNRLSGSTGRAIPAPGRSGEIGP